MLQEDETYCLQYIDADTVIASNIIGESLSHVNDSYVLACSAYAATANPWFSATMQLGQVAFEGLNGVFYAVNARNYQLALLDQVFVDLGMQGIKNDLLTSGNDGQYLCGHSGDDTYIINMKTGVTVIKDYSDYNSGNNDTILFGADISPKDVVFWRSGNSLLVYDMVGNDIVIILENFSLDTRFLVENYVFTDGTVLTAEDVNKMVQFIYGTDYDDELTDFAGDNIIIGAGGNDTITLGNGSNVIYGGDGNDKITGGRGNDTYVFNTGDGNDTISDYSVWGSPNDTLQFGIEISLNEVDFQREGANLKITSKGSEDSVEVLNFFKGNDYHIENFVFDDGTKLSSKEIMTIVENASEL